MKNLFDRDHCDHQVFGTGRYLTSLNIEQPCIKDDRHGLFKAQAKHWRHSTIGEVIDQEIDYSKAYMGKLSEHELAFYMMTQYSEIAHDTPCLVGSTSRNKSIIVDQTEYRSRCNIVHSRELLAQTVDAILIGMEEVEK